jgi:hypothetical protein
MIINDKEASRRLDSPMNLINKLKSINGSKNSAMQLFGIGRKASSEGTQVCICGKYPHTKECCGVGIGEIKETFNPFQPLAEIPPIENLDTILVGNESQIKLGLAHDRALELLNRSTEMLLTKLDDVSASKLPSVISAASKTVEGIRRERLESTKNNKDREVHFHFYTPDQKKISDYEVIDVAGVTVTA